MTRVRYGWDDGQWAWVEFYDEPPKYRVPWNQRGRVTMSKRWDEMTPEQQRAIGEAAVKLESCAGPCNFPNVFGETATMRALGELRDAVRAAECPTWSAGKFGHSLRCSDGRFLLLQSTGNAFDVAPVAGVMAAALNAHERETLGIK